jgi:hypothetical protein
MNSTILTLSEEAKALEEIRKERTLLNKQASFISSLQANLLEVIHDNSIELGKLLNKQIALDVAVREILLNRKRYGSKVYTSKQEEELRAKSNPSSRESLGIG